MLCVFRCLLLVGCCFHGVCFRGLCLQGLGLVCFLGLLWLCLICGSLLLWMCWLVVYGLWDARDVLGCVFLYSYSWLGCACVVDWYLLCFMVAYGWLFLMCW